MQIMKPETAFMFMGLFPSLLLQTAGITEHPSELLYSICMHNRAY